MLQSKDKIPIIIYIDFFTSYRMLMRSCSAEQTQVNESEVQACLFKISFVINFVLLSFFSWTLKFDNFWTIHD